MPELEHLSYSSISKYTTCARQWRYKYVADMSVSEHNARVEVRNVMSKQTPGPWRLARKRGDTGLQALLGTPSHKARLLGRR